MVRNAVSVPPTAPKAETTANPIEPQLQAPAPAPMIEPMNPEPAFLELFRIMRILKILMLITRPDNAATIMISKKLGSAYVGT